MLCSLGFLFASLNNCNSFGLSLLAMWSGLWLFSLLLPEVFVVNARVSWNCALTATEQSRGTILYSWQSVFLFLLLVKCLSSLQQSTTSHLCSASYPQWCADLQPGRLYLCGLFRYQTCSPLHLYLLNSICLPSSLFSNLWRSPTVLSKVMIPVLFDHPAW